MASMSLDDAVAPGSSPARTPATARTSSDLAACGTAARQSAGSEAEAEAEAAFTFSGEGFALDSPLAAPPASAFGLGMVGVWAAACRGRNLTRLDQWTKSAECPSPDRRATLRYILELLLLE